MTLSLPDPAASAAVFIGSSTYRDSRLGALPGVANNVADLAATFADHELWGLPAQRSCTLLDCADTTQLIGPLSHLAEDARDTFIVYFSGHGLLSREGDLVLATRATNPDFPTYTGLPYAFVRDIVGRCRAARRIVILDCCFSGRALRAMSDTATAVIGQVDVDGSYVMTSAPATSPSLALEDARNTAFTGGLLAILGRGIPGDNELLSLDDVYDQTLKAMARRGWPRPQRLGTNTIGRLGILRNRSWRKARKASAPAPREPVADAGQHRHVAEGVRAAVAVVAPTLGPTGQDGLEALHRSFGTPDAVSSPGTRRDRGKEAGVALVRETMLTMREQYGDGATTAAVILGVLIDGLQTLLESGAGPGQLESALGAGTTRLAHELVPTGRSPSDVPEPSVSSGDGLSAAVWTALGRHQTVDAVVAAARSVGAGNVEVVSAPIGAGSAAASAFVLESTVLAPNAASGPIALEDPVVVASTDGEIDTQALLAAAGKSRPAILIVAPRVSIFAVRSLLHAFSQVVVVRPANPGLDLAALRDRMDPGHAGHGRARRALVLPTATTIDRPDADLELPRSRVTLTIPDGDGAGPDQMAIAVRALAVARSVADAGVVAGAGSALRAAAKLYETHAAPEPVAALICAAASEPHKRLQPTATGDEHGHAPGRQDAASPVDMPVVDPLATVRGALAHAAATAGRYLSGF